MIRHLIIAAVLVFPAGGAWGDGEAEGCPPGAECEEAQPIVEPAPDPSPMPKLDKRLPPVLPGQSVEIGGRKMKVWSTSGPVPVGNPPEPWREFNGRTYLDTQDLDVIVDQRSGRRGKRSLKEGSAKHRQP